MSERRTWTLAEANALLPRLKHLVGQQMLRASEIERSAQRLRKARAAAVAAEAPGAAAQPDATDDTVEEQLQARIEAYEQAWKDIEALGVVVKDPRSGLCDFYSRVEGKAVWLCWRYGEESVEHYHDLDAGFASRRPLRGRSDRSASLNAAAAAARRRLLN